MSSFEGKLLAPPLTGIIEDLGTIGDSGRVIMILKLETPVTDEQLLPARMGKRTTVMVVESEQEPTPETEVVFVKGTDLQWTLDNKIKAFPVVVCPRCQGFGYDSGPTDTCPKCNGTRWVKEG